MSLQALLRRLQSGDAGAFGLQPNAGLPSNLPSDPRSPAMRSGDAGILAMLRQVVAGQQPQAAPAMPPNLYNPAMQSAPPFSLMAPPPGPGFDSQGPGMNATLPPQPPRRQGFFSRLTDGLMGIPADANITDDERRAMRSRSLMSAGLNLMSNSFGRPGQAAPSIGRNLPGAIAAGQAGAMGYLTQQDALTERAMEPRIREVLDSVNISGGDIPSMEAGLQRLLRLPGRDALARANVLREYIQSQRGRAASVHYEQDAQGRLLSIQDGVATPVRDAGGQGIMGRAPGAGVGHYFTGMHNGKAEIGVIEPDGNTRWTGNAPPPRAPGAVGLAERAANFAANQVNLYMRQLGGTTAAPSALDALVAHWATRGGATGLRRFMSDNAHLLESARLVFGQAHMMAGWGARRGSGNTIEAAGGLYIPEAGDGPAELRLKTERRRNLAAYINSTGGQAAAAMRALPVGIMGTGLDQGGADDGPPEAP